MTAVFVHVCLSVRVRERERECVCVCVLLKSKGPNSENFFIDQTKLVTNNKDDNYFDTFRGILMANQKLSNSTCLGPKSFITLIPSTW